MLIDELIDAPIHTAKFGTGDGADRRADLLDDREDGATTSSSATRRLRPSMSAWCATARLAYSRDTWLGGQWTGHLLGISSVDVRSIGAGGGSIAWIDEGGLMRVGPQSAGAEPGPACYGRGGTMPTVSDAACVPGLLRS